jgi:hypothetical protein
MPMPIVLEEGFLFLLLKVHYKMKSLLEGNMIIHLKENNLVLNNVRKEI